MVKKRLGCKWSWFWKGAEIQKPNHLKSGQMATIMSKTIWNPDKWPPFCKKNIWNRDKNVQILNGPDHSNSHSLSPTIWKPYYLKFNLQKVRFSNVSVIKWLNFRSYCTPKLCLQFRMTSTLTLPPNCASCSMDYYILVAYRLDQTTS